MPPIRTGVRTSCAAVAFLLLLLPWVRAAEPDWKAGLATVKITPEQPVFLAGYSARTQPFEKVEADLFVKALALEDRTGKRAVLVTSDLLGFTAAVAEPIRERLQQQTGLKRDQLLLTSSHIHTGPVLSLDASARENLTAGDAQRTVAYTKQLQDKVVEAVEKALARLEPVQLSWGSGVAHFVMNRRQFTPTGVILGANPRGLADRSVPVLRVDGADGKPRAVVFGAAVHNTTLRPQHNVVCGDYAGFAQSYLQEKLPGVQAMFVLGCAGDADPYPHGSMALAREHGAALGKEVCRVLETKLQPVRGPLQTVLADADLPLQEPPARAELEKQAAAKRGYQAWVAQQLLARMERGEKPATHYRCPQAVWQFGSDLTLAALSGEVVVDYVPLLEKALGPNRLWLAAYANDVFGYVPSARVLAEGGYETRGLYAGGLGLFQPQAEGILVETVRKLAVQAGREVPVAPAPEALAGLRRSLTFHAAFDKQADADFARGDRRLWTASNGKRTDAKPGLHRADVTIAAGKGRFGDALHFGKNDKSVIFFQADKNLPYRVQDWSGTVSFWLSLDPDKDLEPGYCDPIQITDKKWDDAALFVDFTKDDQPRHFRLGVFADTKVWNPQGRKFEDLPAAAKPFSAALVKPPFARDRWTHVAFTFARFNTGKEDGEAHLYLDGQLQGSIRDRKQTFTWETSKAAIMLGLSYIGRFDDLALFDRALTAQEITTLYRLEQGAAALRP